MLGDLIARGRIAVGLVEIQTTYDVLSNSPRVVTGNLSRYTCTASWPFLVATSLPSSTKRACVALYSRIGGVRTVWQHGGK